MICPHCCSHTYQLFLFSDLKLEGEMVCACVCVFACESERESLASSPCTRAHMLNERERERVREVRSNLRSAGFVFASVLPVLWHSSSHICKDDSVHQAGRQNHHISTNAFKHLKQKLKPTTPRFKCPPNLTFFR